MFEWLMDNLWAVWVIAMLLALVVEMFMLDFIFLMLAAGALGAGAADLLGAPLALQLGIFAIVSVLMLWAVRPIALRHMTDSIPKKQLGTQALIGQRATVTEESLTKDSGYVRVAGEVWSARTEVSQSLAVGTEVQIARVDGAILWVLPLPQNAQ